MKIQELFLKARVLKVKGGPVDLRAVDAGAFQHPVQKVRFVAVHADGLQVALVKGHGLQKGLQGGSAVVGQEAPGNGGRHAAAGVGVVGGAGEQNGAHLPVRLEFRRHVPRLLIKVRAVIDELDVRQLPLRHPAHHIYRDFRANHTNFHSKFLRFDN